MNVPRFLIRRRKSIEFYALFVMGPFRNQRFNSVFNNMRVNSTSSRGRGRRNADIRKLCRKLGECIVFFKVRPRKSIVVYVFFATGPFRNPRFKTVLNKMRVRSTSSRGQDPSETRILTTLFIKCALRMLEIIIGMRSISYFAVVAGLQDAGHSKRWINARFVASPTDKQ